jgi:hypothetical protein
MINVRNIGERETCNLFSRSELLRFRIVNSWSPNKPMLVTEWQEHFVVRRCEIYTNIGIYARYFLLLFDTKFKKRKAGCIFVYGERKWMFVEHNGVGYSCSRHLHLLVGLFMYLVLHFRQKSHLCYCAGELGPKATVI